MKMKDRYKVKGVGYKEESTEGGIHRWALKEGSE
jgi:hypothetical protein